MTASEVPGLERTWGFAVTGRGYRLVSEAEAWAGPRGRGKWAKGQIRSKSKGGLLNVRFLKYHSGCWGENGSETREEAENAGAGW